MPNRYDLQAKGKQGISQDDIIEKIQQQYTKKQPLFESRRRRIRNIQETMNALLPIAEYFERSYSAKSVADVEDTYFATAILHQAWNFGTSVKVFPDRTDYKTEITVAPEEKEAIESNTTDIIQLARKKGGYPEATIQATKDLLFGECFLYRDYEVDEKGNQKKLKYINIPWKNVRIPYDDTDWIIVNNYTIDQYTKIYGKEKLNDVTLGGILPIDDDEELKLKTQSDKIIQEVIYIDEAQKVFYKIHGGNGHVCVKLEGEEYPFVDSNGTAFAPIKRRVMYEPFYGYHGWGVLDILLPVSKLDTVIVNSTANRAVLEADPLITIATNDPKEARTLWKKYQRNRSLGKTTPFFIQDGNTGTKMQAQNLQIGGTNGNMDFWKEYIIQQATQRSGIDFRILTEYAPTAEQQRLRKLEQDKTNMSILRRNKISDTQMAEEDLYFLKNTKSEFHNLEVYLKPTAEYFEGMSMEDIQLLTGGGNELPRIKMKVGDFISKLDNIEFDITPRLDGIMEDQTFLEMEAKRENLSLFQPGTKAHTKAVMEYVKESTPSLRLIESDFQPPMPPAPTEAMPL